ncbi:beta-hexosaminidase [Vibrio cholerae]|uniref:beta-N-acetylhexosaminidase n=1 Tax=Vibrio cholerae TaxID=666 RepID=UPI0011D4DEBA|nr:beta-N-acetylhexosaminidase [Vibrio cholerae]EGR2529028.1 beta-hexosaminidase [Vibrio cholerae]MVD18054.1 beta-hexosaminidase [Vibrio cholerae]MVE46329.1 beta-hexosaminidase [Vibrio cholerae]MVE64986.1 beta-hexosaminidase [Vibrio cholerae]MVE98360.1 beta-hexosaminidase [Vibrio cholerae]
MSYRIEFAVLSEQKPDCRFGLTLHNLSDQDLHDWSLYFVIDRYIQPMSVTNGQLTQVGSLCSIVPTEKVLPANGHFYCEFIIKTAPYHFYTDGVKHAFVQLNDKQPVERINVAVNPIVLASPFRERSQIPEVTAAELCLIPKPNSLQRFQGEFVVNHSSQISLQSDSAARAARWLEQELHALHGFKLNTVGHSDIVYRCNPTLDEGHYQLNIEAQGIKIEAGSHSGFMHASATLLQLAQAHQGSLRFPLVKIVDAPRFKYRGMMLDCARHFHSLEQVKRVINQLAHYKFNVFHWHLTDDEGWRIEIKRLPQLTDIGAWRGMDEVLEPQYSLLTERHGGFYTQDEIRAVIEYASDRGITVIPEIDVPGHSRAAIKALPEWLVDEEDCSQYRSIQYYNDNVLSPALPGTYQFLDIVLEEVAALFPSQFIHIGADEVPHGVWVDSPKCQALMQEQGYTDPKELQGHLLRYAEKKLKSLGKRMVGWEEAHHGDKVSKDTVIYSWLSEKAALDCAKQGFDVILQPGQFTYLDIVQDYAPEEPGVDWAGVTPLERAYGYEPLADVPANDPLRKRILGIQCALWCELINNSERMEYMLYPRLTALAEGGWTEKSQRDWLDYLARLKGHLPLLDKQKIPYRAPWK